MTILAAVTGVLWIVTIAWQSVDIDAVLGASLKSDRDAWIFALTLSPLYFAAKGIAGSWGAIIGVVTCLLTAQLMLHRVARRTRWLIAGSVLLTVKGETPRPIDLNDSSIASGLQVEDVINR